MNFAESVILGIVRKNKDGLTPFQICWKHLAKELISQRMVEASLKNLEDMGFIRKEKSKFYSN